MDKGIDYSEFEKFADDFANKYPVMALESAEIAMNDLINYLSGVIPEYPSETKLLPPDGVSWLKTDKQRAWFFAAVQNNDLPGWKWVDGHPEKVGGARTGNLGRSKTSDVYVSTMLEAVFGILGFDSTLAPYAPWVVGPSYPGEEIRGRVMYQAQIHVDRWWQFGVIIQDNVDEGWDVFNETFWDEFSKRVQGATP